MSPPPRPSGISALLIAGAQSLSTRRLLAFFCGILLLSTTLLLFVPTHVPSPISTSSFHDVHFKLPEAVSEVTEYIPSIPRPNFHNPFGVSVHKPPPVVQNSTHSTDHWYSSLSWLYHPFSAITSGEDRIALPPLEARCPVYTYYNPKPGATKDDAAIEDQLLLAWRRAWWAQGFKPMILSSAEAAEHGAYEMVMRNPEKMGEDYETEVMKWLAWGSLGAGIMSDYRVVPMAAHDEPALVSLRRCRFEYLSRFKDFGGLVYSGDKASIDNVVNILINKRPAAGTSVFAENVLSEEETKIFKEEGIPQGLANYSPASVTKFYTLLKLSDLPALINSHLHNTFLAHYPDGVAVLTPLSDTLAAVPHDTQTLAHRIASCHLHNPLPDSCPPNAQKCTPCKSPHTVTSPAHFSNRTKAFTLGTIPHPFITQHFLSDHINLLTEPEDLTVRYIRRKSPRDAWLRDATHDLVLTGVGSGGRLQALKENVAEDATRFTSLWTDQESGFFEPRWELGFTLPKAEELGELNIAPIEEAVAKKMAEAKKGEKDKAKIRGVVEGWNLGDTEIWRFVRAWGERRRVEREKWTKSEKGFGRGIGEEER